MVSRIVALLAGSVFCTLCAVAVALAQDTEKDYVESQDEIFENLRKTMNPGYEGDVVEDMIAQFFESGHGGDVDEGSYPASEIWEHEGDLRRVKPASVSYSGRVFFRHSDDDVSGINKWEKELELNLDYKALDAYFRFSDFNTFAEFNDPMRWEKARLRYRGEDYKVTVGSIGALFNRGLALNMFEERTLDFDNEVEGAKVEWELAEGTELTALWGTRKGRNEPRHSEVSAARFAFPVNENVTVGLNAVDVTFPDVTFNAEDPNPREFQYFGGDVNIRSGDFSFNAEMVQADHNNEPLQVSQILPAGVGTTQSYYANARYAVEGLAINVEYKDYDGLVQPFSVLPPLRRWNEKAQANPDDDLGYSAEVTLNPNSDGSYYQFLYEQDNSHENGVPHTELAAIYAAPVGGKTTWIGEYWYVHDSGVKHLAQRLTVSRTLDADWTGSTFLEREHYDTNYSDGYTDYIVEGELAYQSLVNIVYTAEFTGKTLAEGQDDKWGLWEFRYRPSEEQEFNLAFGSRREGFVCSGGVCRLEPAFEGFKVDYLLNF